MREGLFESPYYKFIKVDSTGSKVKMEMIYNSDIEVMKLVQQWMPLISVVNDSENSQKIIDGIRENFYDFLDDYSK